MSNTQWIWRYAKKNRGRIILAILFLLINAALIVVNPYLGGMVIDDVINQQQTHLLIPLLLIMIATTVIEPLSAMRINYYLNELDKTRSIIYEKIYITNCKNWILTSLIIRELGILWRV